MKFVAYFGVGIAVFAALRLFFRKTGVDAKGFRLLLLGPMMTIEGLIFVVLLWPVVALLSLVWWIAELLHLGARRKTATEKAEAKKNANPYSHLTTNELQAALKKTVEESEQQK